MARRVLSRGGLFLFWVFKFGFVGEMRGMRRGTLFQKCPPDPPQNLWAMGKPLSIARQLRGNFPLTDKKCLIHLLPQMFLKIPKKLFAKSFFGGVRGNAPHSPPLNPNLYAPKQNPRLTRWGGGSRIIRS